MVNTVNFGQLVKFQSENGWLDTELLSEVKINPFNILPFVLRNAYMSLLIAIMKLGGTMVVQSRVEGVKNGSRNQKIKTPLLTIDEPDRHSDLPSCSMHRPPGRF